MKRNLHLNYKRILLHQIKKLADCSFNLAESLKVLADSMKPIRNIII